MSLSRLCPPIAMYCAVTPFADQFEVAQLLFAKAVVGLVVHVRPQVRAAAPAQRLCAALVQRLACDQRGPRPLPPRRAEMLTVLVVADRPVKPVRKGVPSL